LKQSNLSQKISLQNQSQGQSLVGGLLDVQPANLDDAEQTEYLRQRKKKKERF
jgi:hypothetical protein